METKEIKEGEAVIDIPDEELVLAIRRGDTEAYQSLVARYHEKLSRYVRKFTTAEDEINDIVQESFIRAHKSLHTFDSERSFSPWMYRIVRNTALTHLERSQKKGEIFLDHEQQDSALFEDFEKSALENWLQEELRLQVREAIRALPDQYAEVIYLRYIDDLSYQEISEVLDKPVNTVGTLVRRAKKKMLTMMLEDE